MKSILLTSFFFLLLQNAFGQTEKNSDSKFRYRNSAELELGGHGLFYSFNYERVLVNHNKLKTTLQAGLAYYPHSTNVNTVWIPVSINELISFGKHHIELGVGVVDLKDDGYYIGYSFGEFVRDNELAQGLRLGYRYQKPQCKFLFKATFTPLFFYSYYNKRIISSEWYPLGGITFGYNF